MDQKIVPKPVISPAPIPVMRPVPKPVIKPIEVIDRNVELAKNTMWCADGQCRFPSGTLDFTNTNALNFRISGGDTVEFGVGMKKEANAGKIGYAAFTNGLDIVGAGTEAGKRMVTVFDHMNVPGQIVTNNLRTPSIQTVDGGAFMNQWGINVGGGNDFTANGLMIRRGDVVIDGVGGLRSFITETQKVINDMNRRLGSRGI